MKPMERHGRMLRTVPAARHLVLLEHVLLFSRKRLHKLGARTGYTLECRGTNLRAFGTSLEAFLHIDGWLGLRCGPRTERVACVNVSLPERLLRLGAVRLGRNGVLPFRPLLCGAEEGRRPARRHRPGGKPPRGGAGLSNMPRRVLTISFELTKEIVERKGETCCSPPYGGSATVSPLFFCRLGAHVL